jgi:transcriptional regulator GlxA family with amidase domain
VTAVFVATAWLAAVVALPNSALFVCSAKASTAAALQQDRAPAPARASRIATPPAGKKLRVAFVVTGFSVVIDFAGPWEVFEDVMIPSRGPTMDEQHPFELYIVSDSTAPVRVSGGMRIVPDYTFDNAPVPDIVVIGAQDAGSPKMMAWLRRMAGKCDVVMSVCTGAFILADAGLLDGKQATTHQHALDRLAKQFPRIKVVRDKRYVQSDPVIFTAGGESSGIDLALHIVQLYFGRPAAEQTARQMEYDGKGWLATP